MTAIDTDTGDFLTWTWADMEPRYRDVEAMPVDDGSVDAFLRSWSDLTARVAEIGARLSLATDQDTANEEMSERFRVFIEEIAPRADEAEQRLTEKFLAAGVVPPGMEVPARAMRVAAELYRDENLPLESEEKLAGEEYLRISGAQTVEWDGEEIPLSQLQAVYGEQDRDRRERAWRAGAERRLQDRDAIQAVWAALLDIRDRIARNAGFAGYLDYRWRDLRRFDYTPEDAQQFHRSVEQVVVPAVSRMFERRARRLGVSSIRPWDREVDVGGREPLHPYETPEQLEEITGVVMTRVDPALGAHFDVMRRSGLLDMESRKNKAPGAYCTVFDTIRTPFIIGNASGTHDDVVTLLHEGGHAMHVFESAHLPYLQQRSMDSMPVEFAEVASMGMELLAAPYLARDEGGFYSREDAARARIQHLESILALFPWTVVVDAFQHWAYRNLEEAKDLQAASAAWSHLLQRYMPYVDFTGLERERDNDWQRIPHLFSWPLYFLEYALAQLGAIQVWANARQDQPGTVRRYRAALALGTTATLPDLFGTAGAEFSFDGAMLKRATDLIESTIAELEQIQS